MYTDEQARQAISQKKLMDMEKQIKLKWHEWAINEQATYNLPYRVLFDYCKADRDYMEVPINPYYPYPDIPKEYKPPIWHYERDGGYTLAEWLGIIRKPTGEALEGEKQKVITKVPTEIQARIDEWKAEKVRERTGGEYKHIWDLKTEQGRQAWLYWFMAFIMPYADDIPNWNSFDMFGDTKHTGEELTERKRYYMDLIAKCEGSPGLYKHEIQRKDISDYDKYDFDIIAGYMWHDDFSGEPPQGDSALDIMYRERDRLKQYYSDTYGLECMNNYGMCSRVERIIKQLEAKG